MITFTVLIFVPICKGGRYSIISRLRKVALLKQQQFADQYKIKKRMQKTQKVADNFVQVKLRTQRQKTQKPTIHEIPQVNCDFSYFLTSIFFSFCL